MSTPLGLVRNLPIEQYHGGDNATDFISKSGLDTFARSPAIFYARHLDPMRPPRPEPTPAQVLGSMVHTAILEPGEFDNRYAIAPKVDRRTKAGKEDWAAFVSTLRLGQEAADPDMVVQARAMAASVFRIKPLFDLLSAGEPEVSAFYLDEPTGAMCRVRPDWVSPAGDGVILLDVKSCMSARPDGFAKSVANWRYDVQAAMYSDGWEFATRQRVHGFVFAAVEKEYPFAAAAYMLDDDTIEKARKVYRRDLNRYDECRQSNTWPGYSPDPNAIQLLTMPAWHNKETAE